MFFCKHKWKVLSEITTESKFEHAISTVKRGGYQTPNIPRQMCFADRKLIQVVSCEKCGKIKKLVEVV